MPTEPVPPPRPAYVAPAAPVNVVVMNIDVGFFQMVWLMIKWAFAAIPALMIISMILGTIGFVFAAILAAMGLALRH